MKGHIALAAFIACVPAANYLIGNVGTKCIPSGPCLIPVAPGIMAPSGVLMIGAALVLRDIVQRLLGLTWVLAAIVCGAALSAFIAPPMLVVASGAAFLLSELADTAIYTPLQRKKFLLAVALSSGVGLVIDSAIFLWLAFGSLQYMSGQVIGKTIMVAISIPFIAWVRRRAGEA